MATDLREIINVSLVLLNHDLLGDDAQVQAFLEAVDVDVRLEGGMATNVLTGATHPSRTLYLDRDRISLTLSQPRSTIVREFPSLTSLREELDRFAEVVDEVFNATGISGITCDFGYNTEMVFTQDVEDTALRFLGNRLLNGGVFNQPGRQLIGGTCRVIVEDESGQWNYTFEPRAGDLHRRRVFVGTNLHNTQQPLPGRSDIATYIGNIVDNTKELMSRLDE